MPTRKEELAAIVGAENVIDDPGVLEAYSKDCSFVPPRRPRLVVRPGSAGEVQGIVKWANETKTPLVPVSSGPPHFRGDTVPSTGGAVIVDLSGMKRIIRLDRRNRFTIVEPGVTFEELQAELAKEGMRLPMPLLPRRNKSVVASMLEREPTLAPRYHWTLTNALGSCEVVWGNGETLLTGEAGWYRGTLEEQWRMGAAQIQPSGPGQLDYFRLLTGAQGSMGIVTWAAGRCQLLPQCEKLYFAPAQKLESLLDFTYRFVRLRYGDELLFLNNVDLASIVRSEPVEIRALSMELPPWTLIVTLAGYDRLPKERVEFQDVDTMELAQSCGVQLVSGLAGVGDREVREVLGQPSDEPYWKTRYKGGCEDIFFLATLDRAPEFVKTVYAMAEAVGYPAADIGVYIQPEMQGEVCHCEFNLPYDPDDARQAGKVQRLLTEASEALAKQGAFFSRPYGIWADIAYRMDGQNAAVLKKVKEIFDPNDVMNPGKLCF